MTGKNKNIIEEQACGEEQNSEKASVKATEAKGKEKKVKVKTGDLEAKLAGTEQKLAQAEKAADEARQTLLRTAAEYDNYRKRSQKEFEAAFSNGVSHAALELLPVIDTLEVAANAPTTDEEYKKGVILTLAKCEEVFKKLGIVEIEAEGLPFDPELHNAVMQEECEGKESGIVCRVMQKGYRKENGRVVRHSMVAVTP